MNGKSSSKPVVIAILVLGLVSGSATLTYSQQTRPRYSSSRNSAENGIVPEGTIISVRMDRSLSSKTARVGDRFTATVTIPVHVNGRQVIPAGSTVEGRVTQVTPAKRMSKSGTIAIDFDDLVLPDGSRFQLVGNLTSDDPEVRERIDEESEVSGGNSKRPAVFVGGGGAIGAVLGGIVGGGKGAVIGGVAGAGAGVAGILLSKGEEAQVPTGTPFGVQLRQPMTISRKVPDQDSYSSDPIASPDLNRPRTGRAPDRRDDRDYTPDPPPTRRAEPVEPASQPLPLSSPEMIRRAQGALKEQGYYEGAVDGAMSPRTSTALKTYQREHNLPETGLLDEATADELGLRASARPVNREPVDTEPAPGRGERAPESEMSADTVPANVLSATATRQPDGSIHVVVNTQANTGGWRWYGDHVVNGDTVEVYARAVRPTGMVTQALTRGKIELTIKDGVEYARRVVVHGAGGDTAIPLRGGAASGPTIPPPGVGGSGVQRQAEELLSEYQRMLGMRVTGTGIELDNRSQYGDAEVELLFALDSFANAAQLYSRLLPSIRDRESQRSAALALSREARRTDRVFTTTSSRAVNSLASRWDAIRQDILRIMQSNGISSAELEH